MNAAGENLYDWIVTNLIGDEERKKWTNTLSYPTTIDEDHVQEFADVVFGGYEDIITFTNNSEQFKCKALPLQNKHNRREKAYGTFHGGENYVNIVAWPARGGSNVFNLHVQVRRQQYANQARKKQANKSAAESGGWQTT